MKTYILLGIAVLAGILSFAIIKIQIEAYQQELGLNARRVRIVAARRGMLRGEAIEDPNAQLTIREVFAKDLTRKGSGYAEILATRENVDDLLGRRLAVTVNANQPLRWTDFADFSRRSRDSFAYTIDKENNLRALSVSVDNVSSVSGLVQPNDNVDLIATFRFPSTAGQTSSFELITLTILQNVNVLAVGQFYHGGVRRESSSRSRGYTTVTLGVTPKEAELLVFAQQKGELTLTLRHPEDVYIEKETQDVDFKYLKDNIKEYTKEREEKLGLESEWRQPQ